MALTVSNRLAFEAQVMANYFPYMSFYTWDDLPYFKGDCPTTSGGKRFEIKLSIPRDYPDEMPKAYVMDPISLRKYDYRGYINSLGSSHEYHTRSNGPRGCVQICHFSESMWDSSQTCIGVMVKVCLWLEAYCTYLATGISINNILKEWMRRQS